MSQAGELSGEPRGARRTRRASRAEIAATKEIALRDYRRAHRPVFVSALRPRQLLVQPEIESHGVYLTPGRLRAFAAALGSLCAISRPNISERSSSPRTLPDAGARFDKRSRLPRLGDQFHLVHAAQPEEQFGLLVEARADAIQHRRDMLAHAGPVRATARKLDLRGRRKQTLHSAGRSAPSRLATAVPCSSSTSESIAPRAILADGFPLRLRDRRHLQRDLV